MTAGRCTCLGREDRAPFIINRDHSNTGYAKVFISRYKALPGQTLLARMYTFTLLSLSSSHHSQLYIHTMTHSTTPSHILTHSHSHSHTHTHTHTHTHNSKTAVQYTHGYRLTMTHRQTHTCTYIHTRIDALILTTISLHVHCLGNGGGHKCFYLCVVGGKRRQQ